MIISKFSWEDIIKVGMDIELEGERFYDEAEKHSKNPETKKVFGRLSREELGHYNIFKKLLSEKKSTSEILGPEIDEDALAYLGSLVDTGIFRLEKLKEVRNMDEVMAIGVGLRAEKDSILFYEECRRIAKDKYVLDVLGRLLDEERRHYCILTDRLRLAKRLF